MKSLFATTPAHASIDPEKILYNVGCMVDLPTGRYVKGMKGENIVNGGVGPLVAVVGRPNNFKSTWVHYMTMAAASNIATSGILPYINTYDTEMNIHPSRISGFSKQFKEFADIDIFESGMWKITDAVKHLGDEWYKIMKDWLRNEKIKNAKSYMMDTPFTSKQGAPIRVMMPTFGQIDSLSKFLTADVEEIGNKNDIGTSGGNMIFARQGLGKARLLAELPAVCNHAAHYVITTAHVTDMNMMGVQPHQTPTKKLQHMRQGEKIKGAPDDFFFLTNSLWQVTSSTVFYNNGTKFPEFPKTREEKDIESPDLNKISLKLLRNKSGPSGYTVDVLVSQVEGILPTLSEFLFIKENDRFGLEGNNVNFQLSLLPSVNLQRTTIRETIDSNPKLRKAIKFTADILQIKQLCTTYTGKIPSISELYAKLEEMYGWDILLETRDNWTFNQYEHEVPFLSAMDLLEMYNTDANGKPLYVPYWWKDSMKKTSSVKTTGAKK